MSAVNRAREVSSMESAHRYSTEVWDGVEQVLVSYFHEAGPGRPFVTTGKSVTEAMVLRASQMSYRGTVCPRCQGTQMEKIPRTKGAWADNWCTKCFGTGELGTDLPVVEQCTTLCNGCNGWGKLKNSPIVRVPRTTIRGINFLDPNTRLHLVPMPNAAFLDLNQLSFAEQVERLPTCVKCKGQGYTDLDALPSYTLTPSFSSTEPRRATRVDDCMALLEAENPRSLTALQLAYGPIGERFWRGRHERTVALWLLTSPGKRAQQRLRTTKNPHEALLDAYTGEDETNRALTAMADAEATVLLHIAQADLFEADELTGGRVLELGRKALRNQAVTV